VFEAFKPGKKFGKGSKVLPEALHEVEPDPAQALNSGARLRRTMWALLVWGIAVIACYFLALKSPSPGLPGALEWMVAPIESSPFRGCWVDEHIPAEALTEGPKAPGWFISPSFAQDNAPVQQSVPGTGRDGTFGVNQVPNSADPRAPAPQAQVPTPQSDRGLEPTEPVAIDVVSKGPVVDCDLQRFGDLIDVTMDRSGQRAWTINAHGQVYRSVDGGQHWRRHDLPDLPSDERLTNIAADDEGHLLVIAARGFNGHYRFYRSEDGGDTWRLEPEMDFDKVPLVGPLSSAIVTLSFGADGISVVAVISDVFGQAVWAVWRRGSRWETYRDPEPSMIHGLRSHNFGFAMVMNASGLSEPPTTSWRVGPKGLQFIRLQSKPEDPQRPLVAQSSMVDVDLFFLHALAASDEGDDLFLAVPTGVLHGHTRSEAWPYIDFAPLVSSKGYFFLESLDVANGGQSIMAVGTNALFVSHDGGATYFEPTLWRTPALWFYVVLLAAPAYLLRLWLRTPRWGRVTVQSDPGMGLSDRAQGLKGADALNLRAYAEGIFKLLQNARTEPPLVIGVTGPWGSGKSSVMLKLADLLKEHEMPTVWFNAWHHQGEDHLLASMLSNIRDQGIPSFWSRPGRHLRWHLVTRRLSLSAGIGVFLWSWFLLLIAMLLIPGGLTLWAAHALDLVPVLAPPAEETGAAESLVRQFLQQWSGGSNPAESLIDKFCTSVGGCNDLVKEVMGLLPSGTFGALATVLAGLLPLIRLGRVALGTKGFDPGKLMSSMMPAGRNPNLDDQLSFRHRFGDELRSTAKALAPYRLVIFIDDLDRCKPENVIEVLEAVNFVVSEAECYVIIGMDRLYVLRAVRQQFEKFIAMEADERKGKVPAMLEVDEGRPQDFAEHYLEKLINLFVAVPNMSDEARDKLMKEMAASE